MERPDATTVRRFAALVAVVAGIAYVVLVWLDSNDLRNDLLTPRPEAPLEQVEIATVGTGRIGLVRTAVSEMPGVWGVRSDTGFGTTGEIIEVREDIVVRQFQTEDGVFEIGQVALWDPLVFRGDPGSALGIDFEPVRIPGELGVNPAWFVDGSQDIWVILVHGRDVGREQSLRILPALGEAGYPVIVVTYRGDGLAPAGNSDRLTWGVEEWPDVEAAVRWARSQGAQRVAVLGYGMGGSVVAMFLHETVLLPLVRGVVLDSAVLSLEATSDANAAADGIPIILHNPAKGVARLRFNLEWAVLDQVGRADEFDVPILVLHGTDDAVSPFSVAEEFAARVPDDLVTIVPFDEGAHQTLWNTDPGRYETALLTFLERVGSG